MIKLLGHCDVDAGLLMIGDPCYFIAKDNHPEWIKWLQDNKIFDNQSAQLKHENGVGNKGVVCGTAFGDGCFPVYQIGEGSMVVITDWDMEQAIDDLRALADQLEKEIEEDDLEEDV